MQARSSRPADFSLNTERLGPLPLLNHFIERMGLAARLEKHVPTSDKRCRVPHSQALGVLVRSVHFIADNSCSVQFTGSRNEPLNCLVIIEYQQVTLLARHLLCIN